MKKTLFLSFALLISFVISAQTQQGYVKTKGRMAKDGSVISGERIANVTVIIKGRTAVLSQVNGEFSFPMPEQSFILSDVQKTGFVLTDPEVLSKQYAYSKNDFIIVMEDIAQQEAERRSIERQVSNKLYADLHKREEEIEKLKNSNKVTEVEYRNLLQKLDQYQDANAKLIKDMVERYAKIDYDQINDFDRQISQLILNGELAKVDSLIRSKGDFNERETSLHALEAIVNNKREELANDYYHMHEVNMLKHDLDSAALFIERRARLDTTNVEWAYDAGNFLLNYAAQYEKSLSIFRGALRQSIAQYGESCVWAANFYSGIGQVFQGQGNYTEALNYYDHALDIYESVLGKDHLLVAHTYCLMGIVNSTLANFEQARICFTTAKNILEGGQADNSLLSFVYNGIGTSYQKESNYAQALHYVEKAKEWFVKTANKDNFAYALFDANIGELLYEMGKYDQAIEFLFGALAIMKKELGGDFHPKIATVYNNLAISYQFMGDYDNALLYSEKALNIQENLLGENHDQVALCYNNVGGILGLNGDWDNSLEYYKKALKAFLHTMGENHPNVALCYSNIGLAYSQLGENEKALEYINKALHLRLPLFDENHLAVGHSYEAIGLVYSEMESYDKSLEYYTKALPILINQLGENHPEVVLFYNEIGNAYYHTGNYAEALKFYEKAIVPNESKHERTDLNNATIFNNIGDCYSELGNPAKALEYYNKALPIQIATLGGNHIDIALEYNKIGGAYLDQKNYELSLQHFVKALHIYKSLLGENHLDVATAYENVAVAYDELNEYKDAVAYYSKTLTIKEKLFDENHPDIAKLHNLIGIDLYLQEQTDSALASFVKAMEIYQSVYGENHAKLAEVYYNIAETYYKKEDYGMAIEYYNKALSIQIANLGENKENIASKYNKIGLAYYRMKNYDLALGHFERSLQLYESIYEKKHSMIATVSNNIGDSYYEKKGYIMALKYYGRALPIQISNLGELHKDIAFRNNRIGLANYYLKNYDIALEHFQKSLQIYESIYGESHLMVATVCNNIGNSYYEKKDYTLALKYFKKCMEIRKAILGETHPDVVSLQKRILRIEYQQAILNNTTKVFCEDHCFTATIVDGNTPASQQGMSGEYVLLEYADWNQDSSTSLFEKNDELKGMHKDILILKDGIITQHHFENSIGAQLGIKYVGKEEKQRINKAYEKWKKENKKD